MTQHSTEEKSKSKQNKSDHQWTTGFLRDQFLKESDRAAVILSASLLDEALTTLIRTFLVPCSSAKDILFEDATSALANFSSKIDMSHRLGLISSKLTRDIHLVRRIRNSFAHDVFGCDFDNGSVKGRVMELKKSIIIVDHLNKTDKDLVAFLKGTRGEFLHCVFFILWHLNELIQKNTHLREMIEEGFLYKVQK